MFQRLLRVAAAAALLATPTLSTSAVAEDSFYVGIGGGVNWAEDAEIGSTGAELEFDTGYALLAKAGYAFAEPWSVGDIRAELELSYRDNDIDQISAGGASVGLDGDVEQIFGMANVLFDFNTGTAVTPYAGVGVGFGQVSVNDLSVPGFPALGSVDDEDTVIGWQPMIGVAVDVTDNVVIEANYRFFMTEDVDIEGVDVENRNHTLMIGARYHF